MALVADISYDLNAGKSADVDAAVAAAAGLRLMGWVATSAAGAVLAIVHGATVVAGDAVIPINIAANGNPYEWYPGGIPMPNGISLDRVSGTFDCTLLYTTLS